MTTVTDLEMSEKWLQRARQGNTLVVGLGKTGISCARFLAARGIPFAIADSREAPPALSELQQTLPNVKTICGEYSTEEFTGYDQIILSPGVSVKEPVIAQAIARGVPVIGDIELFALFARAPVLAVTGSNGKSTVTALLGEMVRHAGFDVRVGGNIGIPALDLLRGSEPDKYVLELSSFQLETSYSLNAAAAVILNVSPDHLDRYLDVEEYFLAKQRIHHGNGVIVINNDEPVLSALPVAGRRCIHFGLGAPYDGDFGVRERDGELFLARGEELLLPVRQLKIKGMHNLSNALAALAMGDAVGLPLVAMLEAVAEFNGLPHRMAWVCTDNDVVWYNDSKGTNVGATIAALKGMEGKVVLIAGGVGKGADFKPLRDVVAEKVRAVILIGRDAAIIDAAIANVVPVIHAATMEEAVSQARRHALPGDSVLLSPACASFDWYSGYEERGTVFTRIVQESLR